MSEPDAGSDLASVRTTARRVEGGWLLNGTKVWTSHAHRSHFMITLVRTSALGEDRHQGLSQLIVDLRGPGVSVRPIELLTGEPHFNEVVFQDALVPEERLVGAEVEVLVEGPARRTAGWMAGKSPQMKTVVFPGPAEPGNLARVRIEAATSHTLTGRQVTA